MSNFFNKVYDYFDKNSKNRLNGKKVNYSGDGSALLPAGSYRRKILPQTRTGIMYDDKGRVSHTTDAQTLSNLYIDTKNVISTFGRKEFRKKFKEALVSGALSSTATLTGVLGVFSDKMSKLYKKDSIFRESFERSSKLYKKDTKKLLKYSDIKNVETNIDIDGKIKDIDSIDKWIGEHSKPKTLQDLNRLYKIAELRDERSIGLKSQIDDIKESIKNKKNIIDSLKDEDLNSVDEIIANTIGSGVPSIAAIGAANFIGGPAAAFAAGFILEGGSGYNDAIAGGATEKQAETILLTVGIVNSILEEIPFLKLTKNNPMKKTIMKSFKKGIVEEGMKVGDQALSEGGTEFIQQIYGNAMAKVVWDENRNVFSGVGQSFFGGLILGGGVDIVTSSGVKTFTKIRDLREWYKKATPRERSAGFVRFGIQKDSIQIADQKTLEGRKTLKKVEEVTGQELTDFVRFKKRESTLLKDRIKEIQKTEKNKSKQETKILNLKNKYEFKIRNKKRKYELQKIKVGIQERFKGIKRSTREGIKITKDQIKSNQNKVIDIINESQLLSKDKGKFLKTIKNIQTQEQLEKYIPRIEERIVNIETKNFTKEMQSDIVKELKSTKPLIQSGRKVGKFTAEKQRVLDLHKSYFEKSRKVIQNDIEQIIKDNPNGLSVKSQLELEIAGLVQKAKGKVDENGKTIEHKDLRSLETILETIKQAKEEGSTINTLESFNRITEKQRNIEKSIEVISGGKSIPDRPELGAYKNNFLKRFRQKTFTFGASVMHLRSILDVLSSNDKGSKTFESSLSKFADFQKVTSKEKGAVFDKLKEVVNEFKKVYEITSNRKYAKKMQNDSKQEILGEFINKFGEKKELEFSRSEARTHFAQRQNKDIKKVFEASGWTKEMEQSIDDFLTNTDKEFALYEIEFLGEYYDRINKVYKKMNSIDLGKSENYFPIRKKDLDIDSLSGYGEFMQEGFARSSIFNDSLKGRVPNTKAIKEQSDITIISNYVSQMEHFIHYAEKIRGVRDVFDSPQFRNAVEAFYGKKVNNILEHFMDDITKSGLTRAQSNEKMENLLGAMISGSLILKPIIAMKQLTSLPAFMVQMPTLKWINHSVKFWGNSIENTKFLYKHSNDLRTRSKNIVRDIAALDNNEQAMLTKSKRLSDFLSWNITGGDQGAIIAGGWAVYKYYYDEAKANNLSEQESIDIGIEKFESAFNLTQQSSHMFMKSQWQRGGIFTRFFTAFLSTTNLYVQMEQAAVRGVITGRMKPMQAAKTLFVFHVLLPNLFVLMGNLFDDDKFNKKEHILATIMGPLTGLFIAGDMIESLVRYLLKMKNFKNEIPITKIIDKSINLIDGITNGNENILEIMEEVAGLMETLPIVAPYGAVASQGIKMTYGTMDLLNGDIREGSGLMLGYSSYAVGKTNNKKKKKKKKRPNFK